MKTASKPSHLVISSAANHQNLFQILLSPIIFYLYYVVGTYVKLLFTTSGRDGHISSLRHYTQWHHPTRNVLVGDVVILQEDNMVPTKWPLAKVIQTHTRKDRLVRVVTIKTATGAYKRPVTKIALLLPSDSPPNV